MCGRPDLRAVGVPRAVTGPRRYYPRNQPTQLEALEQLSFTLSLKGYFPFPVSETQRIRVTEVSRGSRSGAPCSCARKKPFDRYSWTTMMGPALIVYGAQLHLKGEVHSCPREFKVNLDGCLRCDGLPQEHPAVIDGSRSLASLRGPP